MATINKLYQPYTPETGLTWGKWVDGKLEFFSFREGGEGATFAFQRRGRLPNWFYLAVPIFGHWLRINLGGWR